MKRRILSLFLVLVLILTSIFCFSSVVFAATNGDCSATGSSVQWAYDTDTKTLSLTGTGAIKDYGDTKLFWAPWHDYIEEIETVNVGEGITTLGRLSFMSCAALTSVSLPSTLTTIRGGTLNYGAFRGCSALEEITLPDTLETVEAMAFRDCTALKSITFPDSLTSLGESAFRDCTNLLTVNFASGLTSIPSYAFYNTRIGVVEIPECITSIGTFAFASCSFMREVTVYNANCEFKGVISEDPFYNSSQTITFYGHSGSTTQTFVENHPNSSYVFVSIDPCDHTSTHEVITVQPTCTTDGKTTQVCDECGFTVSESPLNPTGHSWELSETIDNADDDGHIYSYYVCSICAETKTEIEHISFVDGYYTYENTATCTKAGTETYTCTVENCGKVEFHFVSGNHSITEYVVDKEPTCTETGERHGTCSICNAEITETIDALGHQNTLTETLDNTLTDGHIYETFVCSVCNEKTITPTHVEWIDGCYESTVLTNPTCTIPGLRRDTCTVCGKTRNEQISANGQHEWEETSRTEPNCTTRGTVNYTCTVCGKTKTEYIDALGHDYQLVSEESVAPTCTETGTNKWKCSVCNLTKTDNVSALGHTQDESTYQIVNEPTCTDKGTATAICSVCNESFDIEVPALGHDYQDNLVDIEDKPGHALNTQICSLCGAKGQVETVHQEWIDGYYETTVVTQGSCAVASVTRDKCTLCGETRTNTVPAPGHKYVFTGLNSSGKLSYTCSVCGNTVTSSPTSAKALWNVTYANTYPYDTTTGYIFELTGDGFINAKDYAELVKYTK